MVAAAAASSSSSYEPPAGPSRSSTMVIDLRVTKETLQIVHTSLLALELQNYAEWSQSRNHVPYALAQKGVTLQEWTNIFDKADALWERRTLEAIEVHRELHYNRKSRSSYMIAFYLVTFGLLGAIITFGFIFGKPWMVGLGWGSMVVVPIVVFVLLTKNELQRLRETVDINKANMEQDWLMLADEHRRKFESLGVDVEPVREDHSGEIGKYISKWFGRDFTMTDGLRFSFNQEDQQMQTATTISEGSLPKLSNGLMIPDAAIHDLNRLLQLNQTDDVNTEEYQRLKSRILSQMSLPFQFESLPTNHGALPIAKKQAFMEIV